MHLKESHKAVLLLAAAIVSTVAWQCFYHVPLQAATAVWQSEGKKARARLIDVQNYKNAGGSLAARQKEQEKRHAFLADALPDTPQASAFLSSVERLALAKHLRIQSVKPGDMHVRADGLREIPVHMIVEGDYFAVVDLLKSLEAQEADGRFVLVRGLSLKGTADDSDLQTEFDLSVFAAAP